MKIYNISEDEYLDSSSKNWHDNLKQCFILMKAEELEKILLHFRFNPKSLIECIDQRNNIVFEAFEENSFLSLVYFQLEELAVRFVEINIFVAKNYLIVVLPEDEELFEELGSEFTKIQNETAVDENFLNKLYFRIVDHVLDKNYAALEMLESIIHKLENKVIRDVQNEQHMDIILLRQDSGKIKQMLRPLMFLGDQMMINENSIILDENMRYFQNIDIRMDKIHSYTVDIYELTVQMLSLYDSKVTLKTNSAINKLMMVTVLLAPLTVITGVYGMNFRYMRLIRNPQGYPLTMAFMFFVTVVLLFVIRRNKWW